VLAVRPVIADELVGLLAKQGCRQAVFEDKGWPVDDEVGRAGGRRGKCGLARQVLYLHAADNIRRY
jgi:hypothetical protein